MHNHRELIYYCNKNYGQFDDLYLLALGYVYHGPSFDICSFESRMHYDSDNFIVSDFVVDLVTLFFTGPDGDVSVTIEF